MRQAALPTPAEQCDVAIVGAGADGLTAAALIARKGLLVLVVERGSLPGGRLVTREFHPGFRASPFQDEIAAIPAELHWALDLGRRGVIFLPRRCSTALWGDRQHVIAANKADEVFTLGARRAEEALCWAQQPGSRPRWNRLFGGRGAHRAPPANPWMRKSLAEEAGTSGQQPDSAAHLMAAAMAGRAADPFSQGSALHLMAPGIGSSGTVSGGLGRLAEALADAAMEVGAEIMCGSAVAEIRVSGGRARGVQLTNGDVIKARAVVSTLDLKGTFLRLLKSDGLPQIVAARVQNFRTAGSRARILLALSRGPRPANGSREMFDGPVFIAPDADSIRIAYGSWHAGALPETPPIAVRLVSATDPSLAPLGAATMTVTLGCIPHRRLDGPWSFEKRDQLRAWALSRLEVAFPGITTSVLGWEVIAPPDIEEQLAATDGDLDGGEMAPDQMFGSRPGLAPFSPRTFLRGLYIAGGSTPAGPLATGAAGAIAARAVLADMRRR
ncbi:MAG: NAD(P)/FAD-dependent oxidoreductase [Alphaproteobacteria bacterium]|nr:NAD(P)/FAD-dependent oxidoreductase [Alphaproteobacteria bacterium]